MPEPVLRLLPLHEEPEEEWDERNRHKLEVHWSTPIPRCSIVALAAGGGEALLGNVLYYLQMVALRAPVREPVEKALAVFLRMQPQTAPIFIEYAVVEVVHEQLCLNDARRRAARRCTLGARHQLERRPRELGASRAAGADVLASLLHQCSADAVAPPRPRPRRRVGVAPDDAADAGAALPDPAFVMLSSCVAMTYRYRSRSPPSTRRAGRAPRELVEPASFLSDVHNESCCSC